MKLLLEDVRVEAFRVLSWVQCGVMGCGKDG
jgi:hypothetical protein